MQCEALKHAPLTCEGIRGFIKRGIRGRTSCLPCSCEPAKQNSSPLVSLLDKKKFTNLVKLFANFKILLVRLSRLLNLNLAKLATKFRNVICSLINFKICQNFLKINRMQCEALKHAPLTCEGIRGFLKNGGGSFFASQARNCKQNVIQAPLSHF